jgi:hypothetical protein
LSQDPLRPPPAPISTFNQRPAAKSFNQQNGQFLEEYDYVYDNELRGVMGDNFIGLSGENEDSREFFRRPVDPLKKHRQLQQIQKLAGQPSGEKDFKIVAIPELIAAPTNNIVSHRLRVPAIGSQPLERPLTAVPAGPIPSALVSNSHQQGPVNNNRPVVNNRFQQNAPGVSAQQISANQNNFPLNRQQPIPVPSSTMVPPLPSPLPNRPPATANVPAGNSLNVESKVAGSEITGGQQWRPNFAQFTGGEHRHPPGSKAVPGTLKPLIGLVPGQPGLPAAPAANQVRARRFQ